MSKDARTLVTLVAAFILPAYYHTFSVPYLSNKCSTFATAPPCKAALQRDQRVRVRHGCPPIAGGSGCWDGSNGGFHLVQDLPEELPLTACQPQRHRQIEEKVRQVRSGSTVMEENGTNGLFA